MDPSLDNRLLVESAVELYEEAPCGYLYTSPSGAILKVNRTFLQWTGYAADALLGRPFADILTVGGKMFLETHLAPLHRIQGATREIALDIVCKDGSLLPTLLNAVEKRSPAGQPLFNRITIFNARERRSYERELLRSSGAQFESERHTAALNEALEREVAARVAELFAKEQELERARKMEALGRLAGGVAHDFNNIIAGIRGLAEDLTTQLAGHPAAQEDLQAMLRATDRAVGLTKQLLTFSKGPAPELPLIDPNAVIGNATLLLKSLVGESIALSTDLKARRFIRIDATQLDQVVLNLVINSRDAMPQGGTIQLTTEDVEVPLAGTTPTMGMAPGSYVRLTVTDSGAGMPADVLAHMFEPFFTTKPKGKGTGLGLATVYAIVQQHRGHIDVASRPGEGTSFQIYLQ